MAYVQHPTAKHIVLEVADSALSDWTDQGWTQADASAAANFEATETPLTLTQGAETGEAAPAVVADTARPTRKEA